MVLRSIAAVVLICIVPGTIIAQHTRVALIDAFLNAKHKYHNFNGNVLVAENGRVVYQRSIGFADLRSRRALTSESVFNIASISKQFTAAAIMLCRERGLLSLDDPLSKYLPEVPYEGITLRQMLTHTSGLPEQNELMYKYLDSEKPVTNRDMLEYLIKYKPPAAFKPGESFKYTNTNTPCSHWSSRKSAAKRFNRSLPKTSSRR